MVCDNRSLGDVFTDFKRRFLVYGDFCSNLPYAQETLVNLMVKDQVMAEEISKCEVNANEGRFHLRDLLAVPMQRVLKYHLLLKQVSEGWSVVTFLLQEGIGHRGPGANPIFETTKTSGFMTNAQSRTHLMVSMYL